MLTCLAQAVVTVNRAQEGMVDNNSLEVVGVNMDMAERSRCSLMEERW